jgi:hypothetical protein
MGYGSYVLPDGREAGYMVEDICNEDGCTTEIDRGLGYLCGQTPGGDEYGCGGYYCGAHLFYGVGLCQLCTRCIAAWEAAHPEEAEVDG